MQSKPRRARLVVGSTWDGVPIGADERATLDLELGEAVLEVLVDAPHHGDPGPAGAPASCNALWDFEVVELFLLGSDDRYLEIELSPRGHWLVLELAGTRHVVKSGHALDFECRVESSRWSGRARIPVAWLPPGLARANAYAIHGNGVARRHLAAHALGGERPDFHRLADFQPLVWERGVDPD
jgi:hypothetical protein